jgi:hypothetical protein
MKMFEAAADQFGLDANAMAQIWEDSRFEGRPGAGFYRHPDGSGMNAMEAAEAHKRRRQRAWRQMFKPGTDAQGNQILDQGQRRADRQRKNRFFKKWMGIDTTRGFIYPRPSQAVWHGPGNQGPINRYFGLPILGHRMGYRPDRGETSHRKNMRDWEMNRWVREGQLQGENRTWHDPYILKSQGLDWRDPAYGYMDAAGEWLV